MHNKKISQTSDAPAIDAAAIPAAELHQVVRTPDEPPIDLRAVMRIGRKRRRAWFAWGIVVFIVAAVVGLYAYPQTYSATVSMSMQQPSQSGALAALTGATTKKYTGVLKSRNFAEQVDRTVHFRELLGLKPGPRAQYEAINKVMKDLHVDDNAADGLLYVTVSLPGPPRLWPDPADATRQKLSGKVSQAANLYSRALQSYLKNTDVDKELSLLRSADGQVAKAESAYYASIERLGDFVKHSRILAIPSTGSSSSPSSGPSDAGAGGSQVAMLYGKKGDIEARIKATDKLLSATRGLLTNPNQSLTSLPEEDPLLVNARRNVIDAEASVDNLRIQFGSSMQSVRRAQERLNIARRQLEKEVTTILRGNTSEHLRREALQTEYETIERQIAAAESNFQTNRNLTVELEKRRNDVTLKLETLKAILTRYAELKLQTVSAQNRMVVIDEARPPMNGNPGIAIILTVAAFVAVLAVAVWWAVEYLLESRKLPPVDPDLRA